MNNIPKNYNILRFEWVKYWGGYIRKEKTGYFTKSNRPSWGTQCYALDRIGMEYYLKYMDNMLSVADIPLLNAKNISGEFRIVALIFLFTATLVDKNDRTFPSSNLLPYLS